MGALSAGPKSVAPVSRPATVRMHECMRCSKKGRQMVITGIGNAMSALYCLDLSSRFSAGTVMVEPEVAARA